VCDSEGGNQADIGNQDAGRTPDQPVGHPPPRRTFGSALRIARQHRVHQSGQLHQQLVVEHQQAAQSYGDDRVPTRSEEGSGDRARRKNGADDRKVARPAPDRAAFLVVVGEADQVSGADIPRYRCLALVEGRGRRLRPRR
jgi:hypothetical protein